ncbi:MAG: tetratricopeptide repeat protein [Caulobacteraceae bacterium]|nr:tetratricopeptide repeat protein [Caulobacteraceae bacterium]
MDYLLCGDGKDLLIALTAANRPPGFFEYYKAAAQFSAKKLYLATTKNSFFHLGVSGLGTTVQETANSLRKIIDDVKPARVHVLGASMGGYGALLFGSLLQADTVIAVNAGCDLEVVVLGQDAIRGGFTDPALKDLFPLIAEARRTRFYLLNSDSFAPDTHQALALAKLPHVRVILHRYGHDLRELLHCLSVAELLEWLIDDDKDKVIQRLRGRIFHPDPDPDYTARMSAALVKIRNADFFDACESLETIVSEYPGRLESSFFLGHSLVETGRALKAETLFRQILRGDPAHTGAKFGLARSLLMRGRDEDALTTLLQVIVEAPLYGKANFLLAQVHEKLGHYDDARAAMELAYSITEYQAAKKWLTDQRVPLDTIPPPRDAYA